MLRTIKPKPAKGICESVQGVIVEVAPHPRFEGLFQFEHEGIHYVASEYAFVEETV